MDKRTIFEASVARAAARHPGVSFPLAYLTAWAEKESGFKYDAVSESMGELGYFQVDPRELSLLGYTAETARRAIATPDGSAMLGYAMLARHAAIVKEMVRQTGNTALEADRASMLYLVKAYHGLPLYARLLIEGAAAKKRLPPLQALLETHRELQRDGSPLAGPHADRDWRAVASRVRTHALAAAEAGVAQEYAARTTTSWCALTPQSVSVATPARGGARSFVRRTPGASSAARAWRGAASRSPLFRALASRGVS